MADTQDDNPLLLHSIAQDVGPYGRHLAPAFTRIASALGEFRQAVGDLDQALAEAPGGGGIEGFDVSNDGFEVGDGFVRPDDAA